MRDDRINIGQMTGSNFINGDVTGNVISHSHDSQNKQSLAEAVDEIQHLLQQLEETNPSATEADRVTYLNIATEPDIKKRIIAASQEAGETAIDEFILNSKYLKIIKSAIKGWLKPSS